MELQSIVKLKNIQPEKLLFISSVNAIYLMVRKHFVEFLNEKLIRIAKANTIIES